MEEKAMTLIELRILFILGLLITAVLAYVTAVGMFAAIHWLRHRVGVGMASAPTGPQAAWRLRC